MIYHGSQYVPLGPTFEPPREGTMPARDTAPPCPARGLPTELVRSALDREISPGHRGIYDKAKQRAAGLRGTAASVAAKLAAREKANG